MDIEKFISQTLLEAPAYKLTQTSCKIKLDQNESPYDWPEELKDKTLASLKNKSWQSYPEPFDETLNQKLADYVGVQPDQVITGAGSNYLLSILINGLCRHNLGKNIIARPSFALYEMHCRYEGISYEIWPGEDFTYQIENLPPVPDHSVIMFASPNNPAGEILPKESLEILLSQNPTSIIVADEAYYEFNQDSYVELFHKYKNLVIVRTLSKTLSSAAIRFGYILCHQAIRDQLIKLRLPFVVNQFTLSAIHSLLDSKKSLQIMLDRAKEITGFREEMFTQLDRLCKQKSSVTVYPSHANFLMLKFEDSLKGALFHQKLIDNGVIVRDVSKGPGLAGCLRVSVGLAGENQKVCSVFENFDCV